MTAVFRIIDFILFFILFAFAALSPSSISQEEEEEEPVPYPLPTSLPKVKSTTLRTIIKPDSEVFHSNSGIQVTFNTEDKHQGGHQFQENIEESALQPVISGDRFETYSGQLRPSSQYHQQETQQVQNGDPRSRTFDALNQFNRIQNQNRILHQNAPSSPIYRPSPDQGLLLSYTHNQQANRHFQSQNYDSRLKNAPPPASFFPEPSINLSPQQHQPSKYRTQPKPIPIPLRHQDQEQQKPGPHPQQAYYSNNNNNNNGQQLQQQQYNKPQPAIQYQQPQFRLKQPANLNHPLYTQHQSAPQAAPKPIQQEQHRFAPPNYNSNPQPQFTANNGLFQQRAPNLGSTAQFNRVVTGAELVESLPKYEQHITETVPLSEINKPFGRPSNQQPQLTSGFNPLSGNPYQQLRQQATNQLQLQQPGPIAQQTIQQPSNQQHHIQHHQQQTHSHQTHSQQTHSQQPTHNQQSHSQQIQQQQIQQQQLQQQQIQQQQNQQQQNLHQQQQQTSSSILIQQSQEPQIVLPINYPSPQQYLSQQQLQSVRESAKERPSLKLNQDKIIPGKGVSTLATDVFANLEKDQTRYHNTQSQNIYKIQPNKFVDTSSRNTVESSLGPIKSLVSPKPERLTSSPESIRAGSSTTAKPLSQKITAQLPDEVPEDLRQQLLSSGILENADISILDYDKVGDVPLENLPPEHLANFYGAGGASQISSSNKVLNIVKPNGENVANIQYDDGDKSEDKKTKTLPKKQNVDLKVVRFDSSSQQTVANHYIKDDSTVVPSVDINRPYNRYLPLKINGEQFPIPDVESLRNKKISSVVVLAPVDSLHFADREYDGEIEDGRFERDVIDSKEVKFVSGESLKTLLRKPTKEHFKRWLDKESKTDIDLQSVVLLVST